MTQIAAWAGGLAFAWLTVFQLLLAAGAPLGRMAWGGVHRVLPGRLRVASLFSAGLVALGAVACAQAGGLIGDVLPGGVLVWLLWGLAALFALSIVGNSVTSSRIERLHGVPLTVICTVACAVLAMSPG